MPKAKPKAKRITVYVAPEQQAIVDELRRRAKQSRRSFSQVAIFAFEEYNVTHKEGK